MLLSLWWVSLSLPGVPLFERSLSPFTAPFINTHVA